MNLFTFKTPTDHYRDGLEFKQQTCQEREREREREREWGERDEVDEKV